jgi:hypothetical protein
MSMTIEHKSAMRVLLVHDCRRDPESDVRVVTDPVTIIIINNN